MAIVFNIAKGRIAELSERVNNNDPANSAFVCLLVRTTEAEATLQDLDTVALVLANANTAELANTGYSRITVTDADLSAISPDDTANEMPVDMPDLDWGAITDDDVDPTHVLIAYDGDTTGGTDANLIPCTLNDFAVQIDGSNITSTIPSNGFFGAT